LHNLLIGLIVSIILFLNIKVGHSTEITKFAQGNFDKRKTKTTANPRIQDADVISPQIKKELEPIIVTAPRVSIPMYKFPAAISVVGKDDIQLGQPTLSLGESLVRVPGVFIQDRFNFAQDVRISIRGFGARAAFGIRGIKILVDGIPLTLPDGQSQVDTIDLGATQRIEVIRGSISALYGNASGGVISIITEEGPTQPFIAERTTLAQFGLIKPELKSGGQIGPLNYFVNFSYLDYGGYREQSLTRNFLLNGKFRLDLDSSSDLTALITLFDSPRADDPGALTQEELNEDRRQASPLNKRFETGEEVSDQRIGLIYRKDFSGVHDLEMNGYINLREFNSSIPFRIVDFDRVFLGGGIKYGYLGSFLGFPNRLTIGTDIQFQDDDRKNFNNIDGRKGEELLLNQDEKVTSIGPYFQEEFTPLDDLVLVLGGRYDFVRFSVDDFLDPNESGSRTFEQLTGRVGLLYSLIPDVNLYFNIAQSFETPTTTELVNRPDGEGGLNPNLEAQKAINYEIGVKGQAFDRLDYQLALYYISLRDELVPFEIEGRTFFRNAGKSRRYGLEVGLAFEIVDGFNTSLAYTYLNSEFKDFVVTDVDFDGNEVPGIAPNLLNIELFYKHPYGFYAGLDLLYVSSFFVNDANTAKNDSYTVSNLRLGLEKNFSGWNMAPYFGIQNLFNERYNDNVRINSVGGRFFEPAPTINVYGGLSLAYNW
jgi:iron complex outermembrane recepter protein